MPGDAAGQLSWHGSGGAGNFNSDLFLGGVRTNGLIRNPNTTAAANASAGALRVFVAGTSIAWNNATVFFRDGNAGGFYTRVVDYNPSGIWIDLLDPLPASVAIGDAIWGYANGATYAMMPYKDTTPLESALGIVQYSGLYCVNSGASLSNFRFWIEDSDPGPVTHQIAASNTIGFGPLATIPNETTIPNLAGMLSGGGSGAFVDAGSYATGSPEATFATGALAFWLKRTGPADASRRSAHAIAIVGDNGAGVTSRLVLYWNTEGFTPAIELTHAPTVYLRGGARFKALVRAQETGLAVPNVPVRWTKTAGPGTLTPAPAPTQTDEDGISLARYAAPTDVGEIGNTVTIEAGV